MVISFLNTFGTLENHGKYFRSGEIFLKQRAEFMYLIIQLYEIVRENETTTLNSQLKSSVIKNISTIAFL